MNAQRKSALIALSIAVAALAMWLWLRKFDVSRGELESLFLRLRWWPVLPLFGLLAGHVALSSWRWSIIEVALGADRPAFGPAFATGAFAMGLGTFLPSPVINVACRGFANRVAGSSGLRGALSGGVDQVADLAVVVLMALPAAIAFVRHDVTIYLIGVPVMALAGLAGLMLLPTLVRTIRLPFRIPALHRIAPLAERSPLLKVYGISLVRMVNLTAMTVAIHAAIGTASVGAVLIAVPLVTLAISAAMLPGAFGISEWSFSAVFAGLGIPPGDIVLFVLANRIVLTGLSLLLAMIVGLALAAILVSKHRRTAGAPA
jgi:hypothetical protein